MKKSCTQCRQSFEVTDDDLKFYDKVSPEIGGRKLQIPSPTECPDCRFQNRMSFRNESKLYHRKCDLTGKQIISVYSPDKPSKVYEQSTWWSDAYDPLAYGREFDFSRPFFEQFHELNLAVPKLAIHNAKSENSDYTNYSAENKDCYMVIGALGSQQCLYSYRVFYCSNVVDSYDLHTCERCYQCLESSKLFHCIEARNCHNCSDLFLCEDCTGCRNCFGCVGLRNKEYCMFNEQVSPEEYKKRLQELTTEHQAIAREKFAKLRLQIPHRYAQIIQCENVSGDQLLQCRNTFNSYTFKHSQDVKFSGTGENDRDCQDCNFTDNCEMALQSTNQEKNYHTAFCMLVWYSKECFYSMNCYHSQNLFGCSGMKKHEFCILNKQYTKEEYEMLVQKMIEHMKKTGEWGRFFPMPLSPFAYNETVAHENFPFQKSQALKQGLRWHDEEDQKENYLGPDAEVPQNIAEAKDNLTKQILLCDVTKKPYKIIPQELKFYREMKLPIPRTCPDQRHKERMALRNPRKLWSRECGKCKKPIETTYAPERPEIVYCERCYLETVY